MSGREHWTALAEHVCEGDYLGEDEDGVWWVETTNPYRYLLPRDRRWTRFSKWHPLHWLIYLRSRRDGRLVALERGSA